MTAEVAILNTHGVALAADSAVTVSIGGEKKVYNTGNKLFALSKYHPIGIMVYNNASFMKIDREIIIKQYRRSLKTDSYSTLLEYVNSFLKYIKNFNYISDGSQQELLGSGCYMVFSFKRHVSKDTETVGGPTDVAIITRGDGFVWIKRKHYFDIKLNRHFLKNYFRETNDE
jgi:hypothetical protein